MSKTEVIGTAILVLAFFILNLLMYAGVVAVIIYVAVYVLRLLGVM